MTQREVKADVAGTVRSYYARSEYLSRREAIAEIVDNAVDAEASEVRITITNSAVVVDDDGHGCDDFDKIATLNGSNDDPSKRTGRFGQGLKVAAIRFGDRLIVDSRTEEARLRFAIDWPALTGPIESIEDPHEGETGTTVRIESLRGTWRKSDIETAARDLEWTYRPWLADGNAIVFDGAPLRPRPLPRMRDTESAVLRFSDGRTAKVTAGILVADGYNPGIEVFYRIRHVCRLNPPKGTSGFFASVELHDKPGVRVRDGGPGVWRLNLHKTEIPPEQVAELREAIEKQLANLVRQSQQEPFELQHMSMLDVRKTRSTHTDTGGGRKVPPGPGPSDGGNGECGSGEDGDCGNDGDPKDDARGGVKMIVQRMRHEWMLGEAQEPPTVALNERHPMVCHLWETKSKPASQDALALLCGLLLVEKPDGQQELLSDTKRLHKSLGRALLAYWRRKKGD